MRRIVLPQAARVIVPPLGNEFNNMLKTTSLLTSSACTSCSTTREIGYSSYVPAGRVLPRRRVLVPPADDDLDVHPGRIERPARRRASAATELVLPRAARGSRGHRGRHPTSARAADDRDATIVVRRRGRPQALRPARGAEGRLARRRASARWSASSARPAPARRPSSAASTTSRRSTAAGSLGQRPADRLPRRRATSSSRTARRTSPGSARRSGWSSSASTSSRT